MGALCFVLGAATFAAVNTLLYLMANPTFPNPGDQPDLRLPLAGVLAVVLAITLLLGHGGRAFGLGFVTGLLAAMLFMGGCTTHWANPGGTALRNAALARRMAAAQVLSDKRAREKWISEMRRRGLDLDAGVPHLLLAVSCAITQRQKRGEFPDVKGSLPDVGEGCYELNRLQGGPSGWRILYSRVPGKPGDSTLGFLVRARPDTALRLPGPLLETDYRGLILRRDSANAPAFAVGSPLHPIQAAVFDCISKGSDVKPESPTGVMTLRDLVFTRQIGCSRIQLRQVKNDNGVVSPNPNLARLFIPGTGPYVGTGRETIATTWDLFYVAHGKKPADGYDLHVRPTTYGHTGIRSYLLTAGRIHVTWQDRRATPSDPPAEVCESQIRTACGS